MPALCHWRWVEQHFCIFYCNAEPVEGLYRKQSNVPLRKNLYLVGRGQLTSIPSPRRKTITPLFMSEITDKYFIFGRPSSKIIKWKDPEGNTTSSNSTLSQPMKTRIMFYVLPPPTNLHLPQLGNEALPQYLTWPQKGLPPDLSPLEKTRTTLPRS